MRRFLAAFVAFELLFPQTLLAGGSPEPLNLTQPTSPVKILGGTVKSFSTLKDAIMNSFPGVDSRNLKIFDEPANPTSGTSPSKTYLILYGVNSAEGRSFYTQSFNILRSGSWTNVAGNNPKQAPLAKALQAEIAFSTGTDYKLITNLSQKSIMNGSTQVYEVNYKVGPKSKMAFISRTQAGSDSHYRTEDFNALKAPFLARANNEIQRVQGNFTQMDNAINAFTFQLNNKIIPQTSSEIDSKKAQLKSIVGKLIEAGANPQFSAAAKAKISAAIATANLAIKNAGSTAINKYLDGLKTFSIVPGDPQQRTFAQLKADKEQAPKYLADLNKHLSNINTAATLTTVIQTDKLFPQEPPRKIIKPADLSLLDPRPKIKKAIDDALAFLQSLGIADDFTKAQNALLKRVEDASQDMQDKRGKMKTALDAFTPLVTAQLNPIEQAIQSKRTTFGSLLQQLAASLTQPGISATIKAQINAFMSPQNLKDQGLDDAGLDQKTQEFLSAKRAASVMPAGLDSKQRTLAQLEADYKLAGEFLTALTHIRLMIEQAKTKETFDQLDRDFPVLGQIVITPINPDSLDPRGRLEAGIGEANALLNWIQNPANFVKQVAADVKDNSFDINHNGQLDKQDLGLYDGALAEYYRIGPGSFDASFRGIFPLTDFTNQLRTYFNYATAAEKLGWLHGAWSLRRGAMNPVWKNSIFPFFADQTLKMSLKAAQEAGGNVPRDLAWPMAELVSAVKKEGRGNEWFSKIGDYLQKTLLQRPDEPSSRFEARKQVAAELWEKNRMLVHFLKQSNCHNKDCTGGFIDSTMEVAILKRIQQLIKEKVVPDLENLDVLMFYHDNGGFGGENMPYVVQMFMDDWNAVKIFTHESGHVFGYTQMEVPGAPGDFVVAYNESEHSVSAQPPNVMFSANGMFSGYGGDGTKPHEDFAEGIQLWAANTQQLIGRAIARFQTTGKIDLLEKTMILAKLYHKAHQDPVNALVTYQTDQYTAAVTKTNLPAAWNTNGQIAQLTLNGKTYSFTYNPTTKRLIGVREI